MRKLVLILIGFIAVITFIRAFDNTTEIQPDVIRINTLHAERPVAAE
jgi:hypothetical protein